MSISRTISVTCPGCRRVMPFTVWESINTSQNPELKAAVRDGSLFRITCPHCGREDRVKYGMIYHEPESRVMIQAAKSAGDARRAVSLEKDQRLMAIQKELGLEQYHYFHRVVVTFNRLREKLAILDCGLDDRLMEIYKVYLLARYREKKPEEENADLIFFLSPQGETGFQLLHAPGERYILFNREFYSRLTALYLDALKPMREDGPVIDRRWAEQYLAGPEQTV